MSFFEREVVRSLDLHLRLALSVRWRRTGALDGKMHTAHGYLEAQQFSQPLPRTFLFRTLEQLP